ncbi:MAG: hypothetical protein DCF16_05985 [Alphaproteobacteria bacterium]|nr:MAG: hypothetical protein DCF16_05985 [Alphaproteobacteria bacterium]
MIGRRISRRVFAGTVAATALVGPAAAAGLTSDEVTIGAANAPVHLIEYASSTCPHCAEFHETAWATLKTQYIDAGRVRFTFREMATAPQAVALAMFQLARCETTAPDEYLRRVGVLFERQAAIFSTPTGEAVQAALLALGGEWGLAPTQVMAAINDPAGPPRIIRSMEQAAALGVTSTPSFLLNGQKLEDHAFHTLEGMQLILDAA